MQNTPEHGYVPVKNYLSSTLRVSTRFHDPSGFAGLLGYPDQSREQFLVGADDAWTVNNAVNVATSYPTLYGDATPSMSPNSASPTTKERPTINETPYERQTRPALITPKSIEGKRLLYSILEYETLLDSANMSMKEWSRIATDIELNYDLFDAFVILHGTDTMAYTASALSFMLEHLGKTVIITGSQIPLAEVRNDAVENLLGSLTIAGHFVIPEVCLYFGNRLFRGNRTSKQDALDFDAFESPNMEPLVKVGIDIKVDWSLVLRPRELKKFRAHKKTEPRVATLKLFPGIAIETLEAFLSGSIRGIVLETFGSGNAPSNRPDLLAAMKSAIHERGVVIVNTTQCRRGSVSDVYETGKGLTAIGVVPGHDMTPECALVKLSYLLSKNLASEDIATLIRQNLRGELTPTRQEALSDGNLLSPTRERGGFVEEMLNLVQQSGTIQPIVPSMEASLDLSASYASLDRVPIAETPHASLERELLPLLVISCITRNDIQGLSVILERNGARAVGAKFGTGKTALHLACSAAQPGIVHSLLSAGASVHARDREGHTPLYDAIFAASDGTATFVDRRRECLALLRETGAHLGGWVTITRTISRRGSHGSGEAIADAAEKLRVGEARDLLWKAALAASAGDVEMISLLLDCGVDMLRDVVDGRTVLHICCGAAPRPSIARLIIERQLASKSALPRDRWGKTPIDDAEFGLRHSQGDEARSFAECLALFSGLE